MNKYFLIITALLTNLCVLCGEEKNKPFQSLQGNNSSESSSGVMQTINNIHATADKFDFKDDNLVANGKAHVIYFDMDIIADYISVNTKTKDFEARGNVNIEKRPTSTNDLTVKELNQLKRDAKKSNTSILSYEVGESHIDSAGNLVYEVTKSEITDKWKGEKAVGNMDTKLFEMDKFHLRTGIDYVKGEKATKSDDGTITIKDGRFSTCEHLYNDCEHYSFAASTIELVPENKNKSFALGRHSKWIWNPTFRLGDVPVLWFPFIYVPSNPDSWGLGARGGETSDWGWFLQLNKKMTLYYDKDTYLRTRFLVDYFSKRGFGYGNETKLDTTNTSSRAFYYSIDDKSPYEGTTGEYQDPEDVSSNSNSSEDGSISTNTLRTKIPTERFERAFSNTTHIMPHFDFRLNYDEVSDWYFKEDFDFGENEEVANYAVLEYQGEHFSTALTARPRVNDDFSVVEKMPELRFDFPRQKITDNIYHQGEISLAELKMKWRDYDKGRTEINDDLSEIEQRWRDYDEEYYPERGDNEYGLDDPADYKTLRFDMVNMYYYPLKSDNFNFIPRLGMRNTYYTKTSKRDIDYRNLGTLFIVDDIEDTHEDYVVNYDDDGGDEFRTLFELGLEVNTKFYKTWDDTKHSYLNLDGMRHVLKPYINYNFIPEPSSSRDNLYYFDDIDRINKQHFIRFGLNQNFQTRRGLPNSKSVYNWLTIENYFDFHIENEEGFSNIGDFGTVVNFTPHDRLRISSSLLLNPSGKGFDNEDDEDDNTDDFFHKFTTNLEYEIADDWIFNLEYSFQNEYYQRSVYSMGSSLTDLNAGTSFLRRYGRSQTVEASLEFPIIEDDMYGEISCIYDIDRAYFTEKRLMLKKKLHCWELATELLQEQSRNTTGDMETTTGILISLYIAAYPSVGVKLNRERESGGEDTRESSN